ncbi:MAG: T9SS type A sorting domain-containing protein [Bacteroidetes bacterium]|nr:T9SS type A sorting domain-containing protein [Bacteroidota bacterium]
MKLKLTTFLLFPAAIFVALSSSRNPNNPPTGRTGAPGEGTCQAPGCHSGGGFTGSVEVTGLPDTVVAEQIYPLTLTNTSNAIRAGFQLTALDGDNAKCGTLATGTGCSIGNAGGRQYVRQSSPHLLNNGATSWSFSWKAPAAVAGDSVHFYFVSLCANNNGSNSGDNVLVNSKTVVLPSLVSADGEAVAVDFLKIYPNPAQDFLTVELPGDGIFQLFDADGKMVLTAQVNRSKRIGISDLKKGIYVAKVSSGDVVKTKIILAGK